MAGRRPIDQAYDELTRSILSMLAGADARLAHTIRLGLQRGLDGSRAYGPGAQVGDASQRYREQQRRVAQQIIADLRRRLPGEGGALVTRAWKAGAIAVGTGGKLQGAFGGINLRALEVAAQNATGALDAACATVAQNVDDVFARAAALDGPLTSKSFDELRFVGRRVDDVWRRYALEHVGQGLITGETPRGLSQQLARRLIADGVTDAMTGFVDARGARWDLRRYSQMVIRTTTREATTAGTIGGILEAGNDLVTISSHANPCEICEQYDGRTYSISGKTKGYPRLPAYTPFHPNCGHVTTDAEQNLDIFENALADALQMEPGTQDLVLRLRSHGRSAA